jgi:hypothetical protein
MLSPTFALLEDGVSPRLARVFGNNARMKEGLVMRYLLVGAASKLRRFLVTGARRGLLCFLLIVLQPDLVGAETPSPILALAGRWAGTGTLVPISGPNESFKCVVTYFPSKDGSQIKQNLRCQSESFKFDAATELRIEAERITGQWIEKINSFTGTVAGKVTSDGFDVSLDGQFLVAKMTVISAECEQSIKVALDRDDTIKEFALVLRKC